MQELRNTNKHCKECGREIEEQKTTSSGKAKRYYWGRFFKRIDGGIMSGLQRYLGTPIMTDEDVRRWNDREYCKRHNGKLRGELNKKYNND